MKDAVYNNDRALKQLIYVEYIMSGYFPKN